MERHVACFAWSPMTPIAWTKPEFRELSLSAEIGMYYEDGDGLLELETLQSESLHPPNPNPVPKRADPPGRT